jgi:hypothetical protein
MAYFDEATETLPREHLAGLQLTKLRATLAFRPRVHHVARNALPRFEMQAKRFHVRLGK